MRACLYMFSELFTSCVIGNLALAQSRADNQGDKVDRTSETLPNRVPCLRSSLQSVPSSGVDILLDRMEVSLSDHCRWPASMLGHLYVRLCSLFSLIFLLLPLQVSSVGTDSSVNN